MGQAKIRKLNGTYFKMPTPAVVTTPEDFDKIQKALREIKSRSFSGRNLELGKMINCQFCDLRHRESDANCKREQKFAHRWGVDNEGKKVYTSEELVAGVTPETESVDEARHHRLEYGVKIFARRRFHPHSNRRRKALENRYESRMMEFQRRLAKPTDFWPSDRNVYGEPITFEAAFGLEPNTSKPIEGSGDAASTAAPAGTN